MQYETYARNPNLFRKVDEAIEHFFTYSKPGEDHREKLTYTNGNNVPYIEHYLFDEDTESLLIGGIPLDNNVPSVELETQTDLKTYFDAVNDPRVDITYTHRIETDELPQFEYFANVRFYPRLAVVDLNFPLANGDNETLKIRVNSFRELIEFELEGVENISHEELQSKMIQAEDFLFGLFTRMHEAMPSRAFAHQMHN